MQVINPFTMETHFKTFAKRAARSRSTLFAYGNMVSEQTQVDLTSKVLVLCTNIKVFYIIIRSGWNLLYNDKNGCY